MSQTDLAKKLNSSVSVISRYELDKMIPSIDNAKNVAKMKQQYSNNVFIYKLIYIYIYIYMYKYYMLI